MVAQARMAPSVARAGWLGASSLPGHAYRGTRRGQDVPAGRADPHGEAGPGSFPNFTIRCPVSVCVLSLAGARKVAGRVGGPSSAIINVGRPPGRIQKGRRRVWGRPRPEAETSWSGDQGQATPRHPHAERRILLSWQGRAGQDVRRSFFGFGGATSLMLEGDGAVTVTGAGTA